MGIFKRDSSKDPGVMEFKDFERQVIQALTSGNAAEATRLLTGKVRCPKCSEAVEPRVGWKGPQRDQVILCSLCNEIWTMIQVR
jgi:hypothetical protein